MCENKEIQEEFISPGKSVNVSSSTSYLKHEGVRENKQKIKWALLSIGTEWTKEMQDFGTAKALAGAKGRV